MGWETRERGGRYYTRSRKVNGQVVREYVGNGFAAELAELSDAAARDERAAAADRWRAERKARHDAQAAVALVGTLVEALSAAELEAAGYHRAKGEWRRWRRRS